MGNDGAFESILPCFKDRGLKERDIEKIDVLVYCRAECLRKTQG